MIKKWHNNFQDAALKLAVRDNIPADKFIQHRFNSVEAGLVEAEGNLDQPNSSWTINLSVLWTSPIITPCDMARLSHILAEEIYTQKDDHLNQMRPWSEFTKNETQDEKSNKGLLALQNVLSSEERDSREEITADEQPSLNINSAEIEDLAETLTKAELEKFVWEYAFLDDSEEKNLFEDDSDEIDYFGDYYVYE